jgi:quinol monooxygenase YgiN
MAQSFGMHVEFTAKAGEADALEALLLEAAEGVASQEDCRLYMVSRSPESPDAVLVTEAWTSEEAHGRSLHDPAVRSMIERAMPLMAAPPRASKLRPVGGKGL